MKTALTASSIALLFFVAGCQHTQPLGRDFGNSVHHNMSMHIIDPAPSYEGREVPDLDGDRADTAIDNYKTGAVIEPEAEEVGGF
jgi:type IV pilus biogenesis protein CpaD/CtpE